MRAYDTAPDPTSIQAHGGMRYPQGMTAGQAAASGGGFINPGQAMPGGYGGGYGGSASPAPSMSNYFSDPLLQQYLDYTRSAMGALSRPTTVQSIGTSNPALDSAIGALTRLLNAGSPGFDYARSVVDPRIAELQKPGYTKEQLDAIRTQAIDPMAAQRDAARQSVIQRFASQGLSPDSGIVQQALMDVDRGFQQSSTQQETSLAVNEAQQNEERKNMAAQLASGIAPLANAGLQTQLSAAGSLAGIGNTQQNIALQNAQMDLNRQQLDTNKILQAMGLSRDLGQLPIQLQAQQIGALNALQGGVPTYQDPSISALLSLMGLGEGSQNTKNQNTTALWGSLLGSGINALPSILSLFGIGGGGGKKSNP